MINEKFAAEKLKQIYLLRKQIDNLKCRISLLEEEIEKDFKFSKESMGDCSPSEHLSKLLAAQYMVSVLGINKYDYE